MGNISNEKSIDAIIVGAGFSGLYSLHKLRKEGFNVQLFEAGAYLGGTWFWNCYPGARVDSDSQVYQFSHDELWKGFEWSERFPGYSEVQRYFLYVDEKLMLSKDIRYNTRVIAAAFNKSRNQWLVTSEDGATVYAKYLILCTGFASKRYIPALTGLEDFKGQAYHTGAWPQDGVDLKGKRVAVIGTGASGVQVIQEIGPEVSQLTIYQRTLNMALPMVQYQAKDNAKWHFPGLTQEEVFEFIRTTFDALALKFVPRNALEDSPEERQAFYESLYLQGGLAFWLATYQDILFDLQANATAYEFWCEKTRARITDPAKKDILAPREAPHTFGTKQPCLEQCYYEVLNQENVKVINVRQSPIIRVTENSIVTEAEGSTELDVIIFATGYDSVSGGILSIDIQNGSGDSLQSKWKSGTPTYLGMTTVGFPNFFFLYGPQSPNGFTNGPTHAEIQGDWLTQVLLKMRKENFTTIEPRQQAEENWGKIVQDLWTASLFPGTESWYHGSNIPGKPRQTLNYVGGIPAYIKELEESSKQNYEGFIFV